MARPPRPRYISLSECSGALSFRSLVDDALRLADRALDGAGAHLGADADIGLDVVREGGCAFCAAFDDDGEMVHGTVLGELEDVMRAQSRRLQDEFLDLRRE